MVGTLRSGLCRLDTVSDTFSYDPSLSEFNNSVNDNGVFCVYEDPDSIVWIGTYGRGLCKLDPAADSISFFREQDGLPNNIVYGILPDTSENL